MKVKTKSKLGLLYDVSSGHYMYHPGCDFITLACRGDNDTLAGSDPCRLGLRLQLGQHCQTYAVSESDSSWRGKADKKENKHASIEL